MADLVNPYANPYLPSFVNQRPRINEVQQAPTPQMAFSGMVYSQIHSVKGFGGARAYNLANGASEILAEEDSNLARIYIAAKDANGQMFVQGYDLIPVEEPKPITMDDLNSKMNQLLERMNKLEEGKPNAQPVQSNAWKGAPKPVGAGNQPNGRNGPNGQEPSGNGYANGAK